MNEPSTTLPLTASRFVVAALLFTAVLASPARTQQGQAADSEEIQVLPVQGNIYLIAGAGGNITAQVGQQGVLLVDTGSAPMSGKVLSAIRKISKGPIRLIVNTSIDSDHVGGNEAIGNAGMTVMGGVVGYSTQDLQKGAQILAHENLFNRMNGTIGGKSPWPSDAWPNDPYSISPKKVFSNEEGVEIIHVPSAHTDGDSIVFFRRSDVVAAGDLFVTTGYPVIDLQKGGSIQGVLDGLNRILDMTIAKQESEGGTYVIPGHGRICDQFDVLEYRDMVTIIHDRIQDMIKKNKTLEEIRASHPTQDYDARYGASSGAWTTDMFIDAVYKSLRAAN